MHNRRFIIYLLAIIIVAIMLVVFLQFNSSRSIDKLIEGNESLLAEYKLKSELQNLLVDLSFISQQGKKPLNEDAPLDLNEIMVRRKKIDQELAAIHQLKLHDNTKKYIEELERELVQFLAIVDDDLLQLQQQGRKFKSTHEFKKQSQAREILGLANALNNSRNEHLAFLVTEADKNGQNAKKFGVVLAAMAVFASVFTLWYITNRVKQQHQLIQQLNESEQKVREAASIKENFMANMSHEIRTPMNAILGFTHLLQKQALDKNAREFVDSIQKSGENLLSIINDVLDLSKIEAGMMRIESSPFSLRGLLHSVETMFINRAQSKALWLHMQVAGNVPDVLRGDAVRLTQILVNLVNNSLKFTANGGVDVSVATSNRNGNNIVVRFAIKDTGIGIPPAKINAIFERFQQADDDTTRKYGGTGLGLSIVKQLIDLQHGTISVNSEQQKGTEFIFELPYLVEEEVKEAEAPGQTGTGKLSLNKARNRILVVEDNAMNQSLMRHLLTDWQLPFSMVENGKAAVELLRKESFSLVLMDIQMPEMDGYTATQTIRNELHSDVPIIAMTAHALAGEREKCLGYGMNEYISKPIRENELLKLINSFLHNESNSAETLHQTADTEHQFKTIDLTYLHELSGGNKQFESEMINQFLQQVPAAVSALELQHAQGNTVAAAQIAHNLKTSVSFLGLLPLIDESLNFIENNASTSSSHVIAENIATVKLVCEQAFSEASQYLAEIEGGN